MTKPVQKTIEMTKTQYNLWIDGLTSGKYSQTEASLKDKNGYCCLGVLCQVLDGKVYDEGFPSKKFLTRHNIKFRDADGNDLLEVEEHVDLSPYLGGGYAHELNDDAKLTFKQIAQRIKPRVKFIKAKKK